MSATSAPHAAVRPPFHPDVWSLLDPQPTSCHLSSNVVSLGGTDDFLVKSPYQGKGVCHRGGLTTKCLPLHNFRRNLCGGKPSTSKEFKSSIGWLVASSTFVTQLINLNERMILFESYSLGRLQLYS
ncbi:unnamed protein product [Ceratitis capitata]|uniref:(Mediterranean fruit fly) hypothetical protein n=1 Tax=Ceratitis capitata TaxID=7213 RepID=A0A811VAZ1_CERCA|nr:unnamed protein product [Ceratitis capitata]